MGLKGVYFTIDALFAALLIGISLILSSQFFISEAEHPQVGYYSQDIVNSLSNIRISKVDDPYIAQLINDGEIINLNNSVIEQIGEFYVLNKTELANNLTILVSRQLVPSKYGFEMLVNDESIFSNGSAAKREVVSSRRLISGLEKFKPLKGATSKVYLKGVNSKRYSLYTYFGGFVGQGNLTASMFVPTNINITSLYMELDAADNFYVFINGDQCNSQFNKSTIYMGASSWDISACNDSLVKGATNNVTLKFLGAIDTSYVGGGFIRLDYLTDELIGAYAAESVTEWLPQIEGIINLYSSFYVPGNLTNITVHLHYFATVINDTNNTIYFTLGNATIFRDNNLTGEKNITLGLANITPYVNLADLNLRTVPIRAGFENVSFGFIYEGNADVVIITDLSGSMDWRLDNNNMGTPRNCYDANYNDSSTARLSVAKCLDKQFAIDILNITGNEVGLVAFSTATRAAETVYPTMDYDLINQTIGTAVPETGYAATGSTCICCGINSARQVLMENISSIVLVPGGSAWLYNNYSLHSQPGQDPSSNNWYDFVYQNETQWFSGNAILGSTNSYAYNPPVTTEIGNSLITQGIYADLSELAIDSATPEVDFTSGLNQSGNTWGTAGSYDGWDSQYGLFGRNGGDMQLNFDPNEDGDQSDNTVAANRDIRIFAGTNWEDGNGDCTMAGGVGVEINITQEIFDMLSTTNGFAELSFDWYFDRYGWIDNEEAAWIKAQFGIDASMTYLGENLDGTNTPNDGANEVYYCENSIGTYACPGLITNTSTYNISSLITGPGSYYLVLGAAVDEYGDNDCEENFEFRFDNVQLLITNETDHYFFRKSFNIADLDRVRKGVLNILSDGRANVYLNGQQVSSDLSEHEAEYWNKRGIVITQDKFRLGDNVLAVELINSRQAAKFDLELLGLNDSKDKAMMVMTDGQANVLCPAQGTGSASQDAVLAACQAKEDYGITIYAVGYSDEADEDTLAEIALCGEGVYAKSSNITVLQEFYQDVAGSIISASRHAQTIEVEGEIESSILFGDSFIRLDYSTIVEPPYFGEMSIVNEEKNFDNCTFDIYIEPSIRVSDAVLTSYSAEHWTDGLKINGQEIFNLSRYSYDYTALGDPFILHVPVSYLVPGVNSFELRTGDSQQNSTGCSVNNTFIYTAQIAASVAYNDVLEKAEGCTWFVEFEDGENTTIDVPIDYSGAKLCYYSNASISYDQNDTYDDAMFNLLDNLDFDNDGRLYVNTEERDFVFGAISVGKVPYPWGPAIAEVRVWN